MEKLRQSEKWIYGNNTMGFNVRLKLNGNKNNEMIIMINIKEPMKCLIKISEIFCSYRC